MVKKYGLTSIGNIQNLLKKLRTVDGIKIGTLDDYLSVKILEDQKDKFKIVEKMFQEYSQKDNFVYHYDFGTFDIVKEDFQNLDAIEISFPVFGEVQCDGYEPYKVEIINNGLVNMKKCSQCDHEIPHWNESGELALRAKNEFSFPAFRIPYHIQILREDILNILIDNIVTKKLYSKICEIKSPETIRDNYYAIFPETDLGLPVGDIDFEEGCSLCHKMDLVQRKEFLFSYNKQLFKDIDIAWTSWQPYGSIIVSPAIYKILSKIPELDKMHDKVFMPVALQTV